MAADHSLWPVLGHGGTVTDRVSVSLGLRRVRRQDLHERARFEAIILEPLVIDASDRSCASGGCHPVSKTPDGFDPARAGTGIP